MTNSDRYYRFLLVVDYLWYGSREYLWKTRSNKPTPVWPFYIIPDFILLQRKINITYLFRCVNDYNCSQKTQKMLEHSNTIWIGLVFVEKQGICYEQAIVLASSAPQWIEFVRKSIDIDPFTGWKKKNTVRNLCHGFRTAYRYETYQYRPGNAGDLTYFTRSTDRLLIIDRIVLSGLIPCELHIQLDGSPNI